MARPLDSTGGLRGWREFGARCGLLTLASYGLLYFSYKYLQPWGGTGDFWEYYNVYLKPLDLHAGASPFVLRQMSAVLTHFVWKAHVFYPNRIAFHEPGVDQRLFFAALFTNWVFLVLAASIAGAIAQAIACRRDAIMALLAGLLCLVSFHTQYVVISGDAEGPAWFLLALAFLAYLRRWRVTLAAVLLTAVVERETVLIVFACLPVFDLVRSREDKPFKVATCAWAIACFGVYVWLRKMTAGYAEQLHVIGWLSAFRHVHLDGNLLFQGLLTQNVIAIAVCAWIGCRGWRQSGGEMLPLLIGALICLDLVGLAAGITNNIGRVGGVLTPAFASLAAMYLVDLAQGRETAA